MPILSEIETQIADSARAFVDKVGGISRARRLRQPWPAFDGDAWREMAGLGWLGLTAPAAAGGLGLPWRSAVVLLESAGSRLLPEPIVPAMAGVALLAKSGQPGALALDDALAGRRICLPATRDPARGTHLVLDAHAADTFLLEVRCDGRSVALLVPRATRGLVVEFEETVDGGSLGRLGLEYVDIGALAQLAEGEAAGALFRDSRDFQRLGYAAMLTGLMESALAITVEYLKTRKQFGVPIGSFQAIQHRAASIYVDLLSSRALVYESAEAMGTPRQSFAAACAKARTSELAVKGVKECVQFHGAIGYTDEHDIGLFLRRAMSLSAAAGDAIACRQTVIAEIDPVTGNSMNHNLAGE
jgi:alkylation response protein AidB-like acyl-CoA dehydrogenase